MIGTNRQIRLADKAKLPYLNAVINVSTRLGASLGSTKWAYRRVAFWTRSRAGVEEVGWRPRREVVCRSLAQLWKTALVSLSPYLNDCR